MSSLIFPTPLQPALTDQGNELPKQLAFQTKSKATKGSFSSASHQQQSSVQWWEQVNMSSNISILEKGKHLSCHFPLA